MIVDQVAALVIELREKVRELEARISQLEGE